jgi:hypothetical protein
VAEAPTRAEAPPTAPAIEAASAPSAARRERAQLAGFASLLALASGLVALHPIHETDPLWHVWLGGEVLAHRSRTVPEPVALRDFTDPNVVQEWLFSVLAYVVHRLGSWAGLTALLVALTALAAVGVVALVRGRGRPLASTVLVSGLVMALVMFRMTLRPEAIALAVLPAFLAASERLLATPAPRRRLALAAALVGLEVVWAQAHGSFILAPALFAVLATRTILRPASKGDRPLALGTLGALALGLFTSAEGLHLFTYLRTHGGGDATRHIGEWLHATWADFDPTARGFGALYLALWLVALTGMAAARRVPWTELALAVLGALLAMRAVRFLAPAGLLLAPLAAEGATALLGMLPRERVRLAVAALVGLAGLPLAARATDHDFGPLGAVGLPEGANPTLGARFLATLPEGTNVLTSYDAGAAIGLWLHGHVRTWVDSRTPSYFDDTDYAVSRDALASPAVMARAVRRFGADALVLARGPRCTGAPAPEGFVPVVVDPIFTTYARAGRARALEALRPCGQDYLGKDACRDGARALDADLAALAALGPSPFVGYLRAERIARCGGELAEARRLVPAVRDAWYYRVQRDRLLGRVLFAQGDASAALEVLEPWCAEGDRRALLMVAQAASTDALPLDRARDVLEAGVRALDDAAPAELRALVAKLCAAESDARCVRFQAVRAAAAGNKHALAGLEWVRAHDPSERARRDAEAWIRVLGEEGDKPPADAPPGEGGDAAGPRPPFE